MVAAAPPGPNGTTMRIGRCGHSCADAPTVLASKPAVEAASIVRRVSIGSLPASKAGALDMRPSSRRGRWLLLSLLLYRFSRAPPTRRRGAAACRRSLGRSRVARILAAPTDQNMLALPGDARKI